MLRWKGDKMVQRLLQHCCKTSWKAILGDLPLTPIETCLTKSEIVASCVNTDFWLNNITRKSIHTQDLRHLLQDKFALGR